MVVFLSQKGRKVFLYHMQFMLQQKGPSIPPGYKEGYKEGEEELIKVSIFFVLCPFGN